MKSIISLFFFVLIAAFSGGETGKVFAGEVPVEEKDSAHVNNAWEESDFRANAEELRRKQKMCPYDWIDGECVSPREQCQKMEETYEEYGFLPLRMRNDYCQLGCDFLIISCRYEASHDRKVEFMKKVTKLVGGLLDDSREFGEFDAQMDPDVTALWWSMIWSMAPAGLVCVPILMNQWKVRSFWLSVMIGMLIGVVPALFGAPTMICIHNFIMSFMCILAPPNSNHLMESIASLVAMYSVLLLVPFRDPVVQVVFLVVLLLCFMVYLYSLFFVKRGQNNANVMLCVVQTLMVFEQVQLARDRFASSSAVGAAIELFLSTIIPNGKGSFLYSSSVRHGVAVAKLIKLPGPQRILVCVVAIVVHALAFLLFRGFLGMYCLSTLRHKTDLPAFMTGCYVYAADFFGPFACLFNLLFNREAIRSRRVTYGITCAVMLWFEFVGAKEIFLLRLIVSLVDKLVIGSSAGKVTKYLDVPLNLNGAAFPQDGSFPWVSLDEVSSIAKHTCRLFVDRGDGVIRGTAAMMNVNGRNMLYTVKHVVDKARHCSFKGLHDVSPEFTPLTDTDDPVMGMPITVGGCNLPEVSILADNEVEIVAHLMFINVDEDDVGFVNFVEDFSIKRGKLSAVIDLMKGDSGGPVFAVLTDGQVRYCGAVSKGRAADGGGNIVSFVHTGVLHDLDSSDDDASLGSVRKFNNSRGVKQLEYDKRCRDYQQFKDLASIAIHESEALHDCRAIKYADLRSKESMANYLSVCVRTVSFLDQPRDPNEDDPGPRGNDGGYEHRPKKKGKTKSPNKDKAARKRALQALYELSLAMTGLYSEEDTESIINLIASGKLKRIGSGYLFIQEGQAAYDHE